MKMTDYDINVKLLYPVEKIVAQDEINHYSTKKSYMDFDDDYVFENDENQTLTEESELESHSSDTESQCSNIESHCNDLESHCNDLEYNSDLEHNSEIEESENESEDEYENAENEDDDQGYESESEKEDEEGYETDFSEAEEGFTYDFIKFADIYNFIEEEDKPFYDYLRNKFFDECDGRSPIYSLFKLYRVLFKGIEHFLIFPEIHRKLARIFQEVYNIYPFIEAEEMENILSTKNIPLFRIFIENCNNENEETCFFIQDIINSSEFHKDKIDAIRSYNGGLLNLDVFKVFIENDRDDYGNDETFDYFKDLIYSEKDDLTEDHLDLLNGDNVEEEIRDLFSDLIDN